MFPVPSHLPRAAHDPVEGMDSPEAAKDDITLDLLSPFFDESPQAGPSRWTASQATEVRQKLESAIKQNKAKSHDLLISNFASVSSHIQLAASLSKDYGGISSRLHQLQGQIDPDDTRTSFLPPVLSQLNQHFTSLNRRSRASAHVRALKALQRQADHVEKLEQAIWSGRGAEGWVVEALQQVGDFEERDEIKGTKISAALQTRVQLFRSMLLEQVTDSFNQAVALISAAGTNGSTLRLRKHVALQKPKIPRHEDRDRPSSSTDTPTPYSLTHIYGTCSRLGILQPQFQSLAIRIKRDIVRPLLGFGSTYHIQPPSQAGADEQELRLVSGPDKATPSEIISSLKKLLDFLIHSVFPTDSQIPERQPFLIDLTSTILSSLLQEVLIPSMPSTISDIPQWLSILEEAASLESSSLIPPDQRVIRPFIDRQAGAEWVDSRRRQAAEDVKRLVLDGWGGWDAKEVKREKEVRVMVEVEVKVPLEQDKKESTEGTKDDEEEEGDAWGFDSPVKEKVGPVAPGKPPSPESKPEMAEAEETDAWGFDDDSAPPTSTSSTVSKAKEEGDDGWDFDLIPDEPEPVAQPIKPAKPVREAKKLGKKVAKAKAVEEDDPMSGRDELDSIPNPSVVDKGQDNGWGWDEPIPDEPKASITSRSFVKEDIPSTAAPEPRKQTVLREEIRTVEETYLVSKACDRLLEIVERCLSESKDLSISSLSDSFTSSSSSLIVSAADALDIFRALILTTQSSALRDVPTIAMQLSNDFTYISSRLPVISSSPASTAASTGTSLAWDYTDQQRRLEAAGEHVFELQLSVQREGLMSLLDEAQGFEGTGLAQGSKRCEKALEGVEHNLDSLSRVLKVVLPQSAYLVVMGYLIDVVVQRVSEEVLALQDITEVESEKLDELLRRLHPLEEVFKGMDPPTSIIPHVPHWLKYQYLSELLHANLVDITYLFDSGALVDFTTEELVGIVKALFADSEKRDEAIERIEAGTTAVGMKS